MKTISKQLLAFFLSLFISYAVYAQQAYVYPAKGQSTQQMEKDKYECYSWAKQQSGFDPVNPPSQQELEAQARQHQQPATSASDGEVGEGVAKGIVGGAIVGEIVSDDPGKGAVLGGIIGGIHGSKRAEEKQQQQQAAQQQATQQQARTELARLRDSYNRAYAACLEGRGYTVK